MAAAIAAPVGLDVTTAMYDPGPFFHGTSRFLGIGAYLVPGHPSNYRPEILMNHIYFTALKDGAGLAPEIAVMLTGQPTPYVYLVQPTGEYENDPNVTDEQRAMWRERLLTLAASNPPILNAAHRALPRASWPTPRLARITSTTSGSGEWALARA